MFQTHPLNLHEIRSRIAVSLELEDLASCACVSHDWNDSFSPPLYSSVVFSEHGPSTESVERNKHLMRHLTIQGSANAELLHLQGLDQLTTVSLGDELNFRTESKDDEESRLGNYKSVALAELFLCNNSLCLRLIRLSIQDSRPGCWERLLSCGAVKELEWSYGECYVVHIAYQKQLCKELPNGSVSWTSKVKLLTRSSVSSDIQDRLWFLSLCKRYPNLESLSSGYTGDSVCFESLCQAMAAGAWKNLHSLSLDNTPIMDRHLIVILGTMTSLQRLLLSSHRWRSPDFCPAVFSALERHFGTIRELDIVASSEMLVTILESCPLLEVLKGKKMFLRDIVVGRPWACSGQLKVLAVAIELETPLVGDPSESHQLQSKEVSMRLSCLTKIESLYMREPAIISCQKNLNRWPDLRLDVGLSCLHSLTELRSIVLPGCQTLTKSDALWMLKHWRRLRLISGQLGTSWEEFLEIREIFKTHGVSVALFIRLEQGYM